MTNPFKFNIGDVVKITSRNSVYDKYDVMFKRLGFKNPAWNGPFKSGEICTIFARDIHSYGKLNLYAVRHKDGRECLMGEHGIEKLYTIQDLADGKCAIPFNENDNENITVDDLNMLKMVLKKAFPEDDMNPAGLPYYHAHESKSGLWAGKSSTYLPLQSLQDFYYQLEEEKKIYTIQDLADGKCALHFNQKNDSLDNLIFVLKMTFPKDTMIPSGQKYYYCYDAKPSLWTSKSTTNLPTQSLQDFHKQLIVPITIDINVTTKTQDMSKKLSPANATRIIKAACNDWKIKLADIWSKQIILEQDITVSDTQYQEMRRACTGPQHKLFDEIFGLDIVHLPKGTPCLVTDAPENGWSLRYADGEGGFYIEGRKSGETGYWTRWQVLDINNLPVNQ